jgi:hypothetical protein
MNHDPEHMRLGEKLKAVHKGEVPPRKGRLQTGGVSFQLDLGARQAKKSHAGN